MRLPGLVLDGARFVDVEPLSEDDGLMMLAGVLGWSRVEPQRGTARELVRLCSGFPLAVAVAGAQLIAHPHRPLEHAVTQLRDRRARLSALSVANDVSLRSVFDAGHITLEENAARLYRLLPSLPGTDLAGELVRRIPGNIIVDVESALSDLVEANLVVENDGFRYAQHDLLRVHAAELSERYDAPAFRELVELHGVHWYLNRAVEADLAVNPQRWHLGPRYSTASSEAFCSAIQALDWYEREWPNLLAALRVASARGWQDLVWQWCEALWSFFLYRKRYPDWLDTHRLGIAAASQDDATLAECRIRCQLAFRFLDLEQFEDAVAVCEPALSLAEQNGHRESISTCLSQLAKASRGLGELERALRYLSRSLDLVHETGNRRGIALRLRRMSSVLADLGRFDEAIDTLHRSVELLTEIGDWPGHARALTALGRTYVRASRFDEAKYYLDAALRGMSEAGSPSYLADISYELATVAAHAGDTDIAREHLLTAERLYRESGHPRWQEVHARLRDCSTEETGPESCGSSSGQFECASRGERP